MKKIIFVTFLTIFYLINQNIKSQVLQDWVFRDSINSKYSISYHYMKTDIIGNSYLATTFDSADAGSGSKTIWLIEKINAQGSVVWRNTIFFPSNGERSPITSILLDLSGNLFVLGRKFATIQKPLIVKYNSAGVFQWRELIDSSSTISYYPLDNLTLDNSGNVYFASQVSSFGNFITKLNNQGKLIRNINCGLNSSGDSHVLTDSLNNVYWFSDYSYSTPHYLWIRKFDSAGVSLKNKHFFSLGTSFIPVSKVKFDKSGNILLSFGQDNPANAYLVKLNLECDTLWTKIQVNSWFGTSFDIDDSSNVYFKLDKTGTNCFKYNSVGNLIWAKNTFMTEPPKLLVDKSSNSYMADSSLYKYDLNGNEKYHFLMNSSLGFTIHENITGIDSSYNLYVSGTFGKAPQASFTQIVLNKYKQLLPVAPTLLTPTNNSYSVSITPLLDWNDISSATNYRIQVSTNSGFSNNVLDSTIGSNSQITVPANRLMFNTQYFWRVYAVNEIGIGPWSSIWNFITISIPPAPNLVAPLNNATNQLPTVLLDWDSLAAASTYRIQLATDSLFNSIVYDTSGVTRSYLQMRPWILLANVKYYWKVNATNLAGTGAWSAIWNFRINPTGIYQYSSELPKEFRLFNNFPNPFNPSTKIRFDIPKNTNVKISVYDLTGRVISQLVNDNFNAGSYEFTWNAVNLASGVYFYRLETEGFTDVKRMVLVK